MAELDAWRFCDEESSNGLADGVCMCGDGMELDDLGKGGVMTIVASPVASRGVTVV